MSIKNMKYEDVFNFYKSKELILLEKEYINKKTKMLSQTKEGYLVLVSYNGLEKKYKPRVFHPDNPNSIYNIQKYIENNNIKTKLKSTEYKRHNDKLVFICPICNEDYKCGFIHFRYEEKFLCNKCSDKVRNKKKVNSKKNIEEYRTYFFENGYIPLFYDYTTKKEMMIGMTQDGYRFVMDIHNMKAGCKASVFHKSNPYYKENIIRFLRVNKLRTKLISEKLDKNGKMSFLCSCGCVFKLQPTLIINLIKTKCNKCNRKTSFLEIKTEEFLLYHNIKYKTQYKFEDCKYKRKLPFDFAIFDNNEHLIMLIETDGKQHFEPLMNMGGVEGFKKIQNTDKIKNEYCKNNNIKLLRIPFFEFKKENNFNYLNILKREVVGV